MVPKSYRSTDELQRLLILTAAAVSDFFVPISKLPQHKIQSRDYGLSGKDGNDAGDNGNEVKGNTMTTADGKLIVNLDPVPKFQAVSFNHGLTKL